MVASRRHGGDVISRARPVPMCALIVVLAALCGCGAATPATPANASPGQKLVTQTGCGSCHALAAAGSTGIAGKKLDGLAPDPATVARWIRTGGGGMPSFAAQLSDPQLRQLATFVARSTHATP
jgi:cytochrome c6